MKQILTFISPNKEFNEEHKQSVKIQIDNSLSLGWNIENIMLITNFEYEYNGIKSIVIEDDAYCDFFFPATKIYAIVKLFEKGLINKGLYWYHDFDCFELNNIKENEVLDEIIDCKIGVSNYSQRPRLCSASIFFNEKAKDIFEWIKKEVDKDKIGEEKALMRIYYNENNKFLNDIKMMNTTYAFHKFNIIPTYLTTLKPIRVAHFHLTPDKFDFYVKGNNKLNKPLIPERLINIFKYHGFKK